MTDRTRPAFGDPFTSHVGYTSIRTGERTASSWIRLRDDLLDGRRRLHTGVLAFLVDSTAGVVCGTAALPSWVVTADLQFEVLALPAVGPARADAVVHRPGRRQSCGEVTVHDEGDNDRIVAVGTVNHIVVANDQPLGDVPTDMAVGERLGPALPQHPAPVPPLVELLHVERMRDGSVELPIEGIAVNPLGFLHGGLSGLLVAECADALDCDVTGMIVRYLGPVREGRARALPAAVPGGGDAPVLRVDISDESGRPAAAALARLRRR